MRRRNMARAALAAVVALLVSPAVAAADVAPPAKVTSNFETYWGVSLNRDCGYSQSLAGNQSFWLFCDTAWNDFNGGHFITGSTAAVGPHTAGLVPTKLNELPTPPGAPRPQPYNGGPEQFLPTPTGLLNPAGQPCTPNTTQYPASWITGLTRDPASSNLLITYSDLCVTNTATPFLTQRYGIAEYNPTTNTVLARTTVMSTTGTQLPAAQILGSPVISGGNLYLYGYECTSWFSGVCATGNTYAARVPANPQSWRSSSAYVWYTNTQGGTSNKPADARNVIASAPSAVSMHDFSPVGRGFIAIVQKDVAGGFELWQATSPAGPWTRRSTGKVPCSGGAGNDLCRALTGHVQLSTSSQLMLSYFNPASAHVEAATFPW
ncbi:hypothetical protein JOF56_010743 [Kibdelosporangium banguiense]|uniref:DUF4185 domain-containing protein n=1 Tax=Kibdelosporangium banguiense TaxID=1365924 RepID=A0ABS4U128_9PSEU|nr:hypothetical protein [Kibdelosporangium banguiense]MBP2330358.1 hypothetical protein [Kibdelosporangium banguiense]